MCERFVIGSKTIVEVEAWFRISAMGLEEAEQKASEYLQEMRYDCDHSYYSSGTVLSADILLGGEALEVEHRGLRPYRRADNLAEEIFAQAWERFAKDNLGHLLSSTQEPVELNQYAATVAATVAQWLGSPVGLGFLQETLKQAGYSVSPQNQAKLDT